MWLLFSAKSGVAVFSADPASITFTSGLSQDFFGTKHLLAEGRYRTAGIGKSTFKNQQNRDSTWGDYVRSVSKPFSTIDWSNSFNSLEHCWGSTSYSASSSSLN